MMEELDHVLVPKHIILNEEEKEEVMKRYRVTLKQLPRILANDPIVKLLGAKPGDVIKIIRKSSIVGESIYYRVVVRA
ncbi:MAG: DNA-directed RNA polymerase subunit H [Candidatus Aenigmarchaeota archaeon]|nr:DNA-directed RNA polymerase subunit H [Candidatus Aenigmarchaeota archaeon]